MISDLHLPRNTPIRTIHLFQSFHSPAGLEPLATMLTQEALFPCPLVKAVEIT